MGPASSRDGNAPRQVMQYVHTLATRGELKPGDRLPNERDLARQLGISRVSLREGISQLVSFRVLKSVQGKGTFVAAGSQFGPLSTLNSFYGFPESQMFETRLNIEPHVAALAATRATPEAISGLHKELAKMREADTTLEAFLAHDMRFHRMIALASGNPILAALLESAAMSMLHPLSAQGNLDPRILIEMHHEIYRAIRSHNATRARIAMEQHLRFTINPESDPRSAHEGDSGLLPEEKHRAIPALRVNHGAGTDTYLDL
jgi:GntR family transcriptional regulator, transcriptional repressor for pyruvate dehydrogenase complex